MQIELRQAERKFGAQIVFQNLDLKLVPGSRWAVLGGNGSGKSTFLKCLYGALTLSKGEIEYLNDQDKALDPIEAARQFSYSGPYFELIEELPAQEFLETYQRFRKLEASPAEILEFAYLEKSALKPIKLFSSGMKQRLRLSLALFSQSQVVILDEPSANLDPDGVAWLQESLKAKLASRTLLIGSNFDPQEIFLCEEKLELRNYK